MNNIWNQRFIELAEHVATWSKDPSTKVGAVIVDFDKRIISIGFNGYPKKIPDDDLHIRELKYNKILHAEINAILFAKRDIKNCVMYVTNVPCSQCAAAIIQSDIVVVVTRKPDEDYQSRWEKKMNITKQMFKEANVTLFYI